MLKLSCPYSAPTTYIHKAAKTKEDAGNKNITVGI